MPVQDDERERELVRMFNLTWDPQHQRAGVDAILELELHDHKYHFDVEVKSTTGSSVSTARDVGMEHIRKWRRKFFVVGFYSREARRPELERCLCLTPLDMEPWIASIEAKIQIDFKIAARASRKLTLDDLFDVCGEQETYSLQEAKKLHKQQWSADEYQAALDVMTENKPRISQKKMLEILQLRSKYISERGATLNNPHITGSHLKPFFNTEREISDNDWAARIRALATNFFRAHPEHLTSMALSITGEVNSRQ